MARFGLIGPSYSSQSLNADAQMTRNWYPEVIESQNGKSAMALYPTQGKKLFVALPVGPLRAEVEINGRAFAISGPNFCEVLANGTYNIIAQVRDDLLPASMVASPQQVLIASGGNLYVYQLQTQVNANDTPFNLNAGSFYQIPNATFTLPTSGAPGNPSQVEFCDGFFVVLLRNSQEFYLSSPYDASSWLATQFITVSVFSDNVQSIIWSSRRLWVQGGKRSTVYYDSGSLNIFDVDPSGTMENGIVAPFARCRLDNAVFWLDQDERGSGIVRRGVGYTPTRISNHAIEFAMQGYPTIADCVAYSFQDQGHGFAVFSFPTAQKTWVYDVATSMWHERGYWNVQTGTYSQDKAQYHMLAFGKHLVGDPSSGNIYQSAIPQLQGGVWAFADDNGNPIRRVRRSPHISVENKFMFYNELVIDAETGIGPVPPLLDGQGNARGPRMMLSWSKDYGHTWSNEYMLDAGQAGQYKHRLRRTKMGRARDMIFQIVTDDPIGWRLIEGYLDADGPAPYKPQQRLVSEFGQVT